MLSYELTHPQILAALAGSGHGSQVLISDGHFPHSTAANQLAPRVFLNLSPGQLSVTDILAVLTGAITIESAQVMAGPADQDEPIAHAALRLMMPAGVMLQPVDRWEFYAACKQDSVALVIASGDLRPFANIMLTQGVRPF